MDRFAVAVRVPPDPTAARAADGLFACVSDEDRAVRRVLQPRPRERIELDGSRSSHPSRTDADALDALGGGGEIDDGVERRAVAVDSPDIERHARIGEHRREVTPILDELRIYGVIVGAASQTSVNRRRVGLRPDDDGGRVRLEGLDDGR